MGESTRKRPAPGSRNSAYSKTPFDKSSSRSKSNGKPSSKPFSSGRKPAGEAPKSEDVKRKRPITAPINNYDDDEDTKSATSETEDHVDENGVETQEEPAEKRPRLSKTERAALHAAQPHRTSLLPSYPLLHDKLLPLWEKARRGDLSKEERPVAVRELWEAVKGRVAEVSRGHKGGRVLQTIVKYGGKEERLGVALELKPQWRAMMESKYSKVSLVVDSSHVFNH
jgi:pumilio family protein 6